METTRPNARGYCSVANWLLDKDEDYKKEFGELLKDQYLSTATLHRFFTSNSINFPGLTSFKTHRNKWCSCVPKG